MAEDESEEQPAPETRKKTTTVDVPNVGEVTLTEATLYETSDATFVGQGKFRDYKPGQTQAPRNEQQQRNIDRINGRIKNITPIYATTNKISPLFPGTDAAEAFNWSYRCYKVDSLPRQFTKSEIKTPLFQNHIYLFNVIIAFEWQPSEHNVAMLTRAARAASDFLFDVTNGWMSFGQVLIGGPELMDCADVQVMASNRLLPRSWIGGLHEGYKYMPIRLGRGLWQKNSRGSIAWDEPEGWRALVHEWAHYALELLDDYADSHLVYVRDDALPIQSETEIRRSNRELIVPSISQPVESIMATLEGTSELTAKRGNNPRRRKESEWDQIIDGFDGLERRKPRFPRIKRGGTVEDPEYPQDIDGPLPIRELPHIAWVTFDDDKWQPELLLRGVDPTIRAEHCWIYVLKASTKGNNIPERIIAQGTLDAQFEDGFRLLGAEAGDTVLIAGSDLDWNERLFQAEIKLEEPGTRPDKRRIIAKPEWKECTPEVFPLIDVIPGKIEAKPDEADGRTACIAVNVSQYSGGKLQPVPGARVYIYPNDRIVSDLNDIPIERPPSEFTDQAVALDGHVLVTLENDKLVLATYAQGGSPPCGSPVGGTPIMPGSSEGNLMVFFADRGDYPRYNKDHAYIRVITTRLPGGVPSKTVAGAEARSYAFTMCSNAALPLDYAPTLSLFYDKRAELQDGEAVIHRQAENGEWQPIISYRPAGAWFVATLLDQHAAPNLTKPAEPGSTKRVERYRLYLVPKQS